MEKYILTADGHLYHCDSTGDELYHYGVPGMKWGRRKARELYDKGIGLKRRKNKREYIRDTIGNVVNPEGDAGAQYKRQKELRSNYKRNDTKLAWKQAKNKAKMDPQYKNSDEYRKIKRENTKVVVEDMLRDLGNTQTKRL